MRALTLHKNVGGVAQRLAGVPMRLWHDHILIKQPNNQVATEFHQDQPYWPHAHSPNALSAWIALCDVPIERGCMSFIAGSHRHTDLTAQNLLDGRDLFGKCPDLEYEERVTLPLKAATAPSTTPAAHTWPCPTRRIDRGCTRRDFYGPNDDLRREKSRRNRSARLTRGGAHRRRAIPCRVRELSLGTQRYTNQIHILRSM